MTVVISGTDGITTPGLTNTGTETIVNLTTTGNTILGDATTDTLNVGNGGLVKDASGNVGIGVTPNAGVKLNLPSTEIIGFAGTESNIVANAYYNAGYKYVTTGVATKYSMSAGTHVWYTAASGTAGNAITDFSTAKMTLDASGNLGIGTSSPGARLAVNGSTGLIVQNNADASNPRISITPVSGGPQTITPYGDGDSNEQQLAFCSGVSGAERARIDSSGNLLVGNTGQLSAEKIGVTQSSTGGQVCYFYASDAAYNGNAIVINTVRAANTAFNLLAAYAAGVYQFYVLGTGVIYSASLTGGATTLSVNASGQIIRTPSDASLKTNIQPITYGLDTVMKLKPIKHDWVDSIDMGAPSIGFIAQDMELEVPEVVSGEEYKSIDYPKLTAVLTKAIQEMKAIIDTQASTITTLTNRITTLENK